ncbi:MAG: hypothetical protein J7L74_01440, partial [Candidatus Hydrothermae bacterium]|nr:hypothetical protein [Candidatus Hydrothermae bacterium]
MRKPLTAVYASLLLVFGPGFLLAEILYGPGKPDVILRDMGKSGVEIEVELHGLTLEKAERDGKTFTRISFPWCGHTAEPGKPELPTLGRYIAVPRGSDVNLEVLDYSYDEYSGYLVYPAQEPLPDLPGTPEKFVIDDKFYSSDVYYPPSPTGLSEKLVIRGLEVRSLQIYPVSYNPARRTLRVYRKLRIRLTFSGGGDFIPERLRSPYFEPLFSNLIANYSSLGKPGTRRDLSDFKGPIVLRGIDNPKVEGADLLIIAPDDMVDSLLPLARWRLRTGLLTKIVPLSEISPSPSADDIADFILYAYDNWEIPPSFVLIVGDVDMVPVHYRNVHPYHNTRTGTDLYYATTDGSDYFPDIFVGRISVEDNSQLSTVINKILKYDRDPERSTNWFNNVLLAAYDEQGRFFVATSETVYVHLSGYGYSCNRQYADGNPPGSTSGVIAALNGGVVIANHRDHGGSGNDGCVGSTGWVHPAFYNSHVGSLTNGDMLPFFFSINCESNWYDGETDSENCNYESLGETLLRAENGGALGFIGATRVSYSGYNDELDKGFFDAIFPDFDGNYPGAGSYNPLTGPLYHLGGILNYGKFWMYDKYVVPGGCPPYPWIPDPEATVTEFDEFNYIGDPSEEIRMSYPESLIVGHPPTVPLGPSQVQVQVTDLYGTPVEGVRVAIGQGDTLHSWAYTDESGSAVLTANPTVPNEMWITAWNPHYLPYQGEIQPVSEGPYVMMISKHIDDDSTGTSAGNGDGFPNPGETLELTITVKNWGADTAYDVEGLLTSSDSLVQIQESLQVFGNIAPGDSSQGGGSYSLSLSALLRDSYNIPLSLALTSSEGDTWISYTGLLVYAPELLYDTAFVSDTDGVVDPGDTAELYVRIFNEGHSTAENVEVLLRSLSPKVTVIGSLSTYGTVEPDSAVQGTPFLLFADTSIGLHTPVDFLLEMSSGDYLFLDTFTLIIGKGGSYLVYDPDPNHSSGPLIAELLDSLGYHGEYTTDLSSYFGELPYFSSIFVCVGVYDDNYILEADSPEAESLASYALNHGGNLYLEGGDVWYWDPQNEDGYDFNPIFGITPTADGTSDLQKVAGMNGTFTEGDTFDYSGENNYIDHLGPDPASNSFVIFSNPQISYNVAIANIDTSESGLEYRTVGLSFELAGLDDMDSSTSKLILLGRIVAEFFGIPPTGVQEKSGRLDRNLTFLLYQSVPNPAKGAVSIPFSLPSK